jgi:hypothetical protein
VSSATHYQGTTCADCAAEVSKGLERAIEDEDAQALAMQVFMQDDGMARTCDAVGCSRRASYPTVSYSLELLELWKLVKF